VLLASIPFRASPHQRAEILDAVGETVKRMRRAAGCGRSRLFEDVEDPNSYVLVSEWYSSNLAETFFDSREFRIFKGVRILLKDKPVILLDDVRARSTSLLRGELPRTHDAQL
jgi:quinol monooxygenase YgiN